MNHAPSLIRSKISSTNILHRIGFVVVLVLGLSGCPGSPSARPYDGGRNNGPAAPKPKNQIPIGQKRAINRPLPPWQLWTSSGLGNAELEAAEEQSRLGSLTAALQSYRVAADRAPSREIRQEAVLRLSGTLLKVGQSKEALDEISRFLKSAGAGAPDADAAFSLIAAYAYLHQRDVDQTLAWLGLTYKKARGQGPYAARASEEAERIVRSLPDSAFDGFNQRWEVDSFAGAIFTKDRLRRARGGTAEVAAQPNWFSPSLYGEEGGTPAEPITPLGPIVAEGEGTVVVPTNDQPLEIGVLLPLSGRFSDHATQVKEGIELALKDFDKTNRVQLEMADSQGNADVAETEYERLVREKKVRLVLGPLLAETTERVAEKSRSIGVPIISFTKRSGVPALGPTVFRLGATAESQVSELLSFAGQELHLNSVAILYPDNTSGHEFLSLFREASSHFNIKIISEASYVPGNEGSAAKAVDTIGVRPAQAVFIPDGLEAVAPILERIKSSSLKDAVLLGPAQWNDPVAVRGYGQLLEGAVYVTPFNARSDNPKVITFVQRYRDTFQHEPELLAAQAYDATAFALAALTRPAAAGQSVIDSLTSADTLYGVTGRLDVDGEGEINRRMSVLRVEHGDIVEVKSFGTVTGFTPDEQTQKAKTE